MKDILCGPLGPALKRSPTLAAARSALAEDLKRLRKVNPELARRVAKRLRRDLAPGRAIAGAA
jgi:hypothetical protein